MSVRKSMRRCIIYKSQADATESINKSFKMQLHIIFVFLTFAASTVSAREFSEDIYLYLAHMKDHPIPTCPPNELYTTCTGNCSDCSNRGRCVAKSCQKGCDCAPRFFRVTPDGPCEPVGNCPIAECGENEVFRECGPVCERCTTIKCRVVSCDHKCYCKQGYLRNDNGICIPEEECPKRERCTRHEQWAESGPVDEFCCTAQNEPLRNETQDVPRCYCKTGFKRNTLGHCVPTCPSKTCFRDQVYHKCIPTCNTTCRNYGNPKCTEDKNCYPGCFCTPGQVMNDFQSCIPPENCSLNITQVKVINSFETAEEVETAGKAETTGSVKTTEMVETAVKVETAEEEETTITPSSSDNAPAIPDSVEDICTDEATEDYVQDPEEGTTMTAEQSVKVTASPMKTTPVSGAGVKERSYKKMKATSHSQTKHENVAKPKEIPKEITKDEDDLMNDDI